MGADEGGEAGGNTNLAEGVEAWHEERYAEKGVIGYFSQRILYVVESRKVIVWNVLEFCPIFRGNCSTKMIGPYLPQKQSYILLQIES